MKGKRKGQALSGIPTAALMLGIAVFVVALLITVLNTYADTQVTGAEFCNTNGSSTSLIGCNAAYNATIEGIGGLNTFNDFWSVLVLIVILSIVIAALYLVMPRRSGY